MSSMEHSFKCVKKRMLYLIYYNRIMKDVIDFFEMIAQLIVWLSLFSHFERDHYLVSV